MNKTNSTMGPWLY